MIIRVTQEICDRVKKLKERGMTQPEISKIIGISTTTVHYIQSCGYTTEGYKNHLHALNSYRSKKEPVAEASKPHEPVPTPPSSQTDTILQNMCSHIIAIEELMQELVQYAKPSVTQMPPQVREGWFTRNHK